MRMDPKYYMPQEIAILVTMSSNSFLFYEIHLKVSSVTSIEHYQSQIIYFFFVISFHENMSCATSMDYSQYTSGREMIISLNFI